MNPHNCAEQRDKEILALVLHTTLDQIWLGVSDAFPSSAVEGLCLPTTDLHLVPDFL